MQRILISSTLWLLLALLFGCQNQSAHSQSANSEKDTRPVALPKALPGEAVATFAGGCFWCLQEEISQLKGVRTVVSGYAGGHVPHPTYEQVGTGQTGHAEAIQIYYNPKQISFDVLLDGFFAGHDATILNREGPDVGTQYRSVAFFRNADEKAKIMAAIARENRLHKNPIVTQVVPFEAFYTAEAYHQNYCRINPNELYVQRVSRPKIEEFRKRMAPYLQPGTE